MFGGFEVFEVVAWGGGEAEFAADEEVEDGAGVAADGAVGFVGDDEVEVGGGEELLVFVVEEEGLDGGDDDFGVAPVVAVFFVDDGLEVGGEEGGEGFFGLVFEFEAVHEEEDASGVSGAQEELDDGGGGEGFAGAGGHFEEEAVFAVADGLL